MRKRMMVTVVVLLIGCMLFAQDLIITKKDGMIIKIPISEILSMTYSENIPVESATNTVKEYIVGDAGPAGGIILYDKGSYSDNWRYIEMAPQKAEGKDIPWYPESNDVFLLGTLESYGSAVSNTKLIVDKYKSKGLLNNPNAWAASYCDNLNYGGYNDWALPSKEELILMYTLFHINGLGGFSNYYYWSSSEYDGYNVWYANFDTGTQYVLARDYELHVRPVRYF